MEVRLASAWRSLTAGGLLLALSIQARAQQASPTVLLPRNAQSQAPDFAARSRVSKHPKIESADRACVVTGPMGRQHLRDLRHLRIFSPGSSAARGRGRV